MAVHVELAAAVNGQQVSIPQYIIVAHFQGTGDHISITCVAVSIVR